MRALLFSFLLNNIPLSSLSVLSTLLSFLFIFPPLGSPRLPPARIRSILLTLCHSPPTSHPLSSSPVGTASSFVFGSRRRAALGLWVRLAGRSSYPICVSIMRSCPLNPALIHQPAAQPVRAASFHPHSPLTNGSQST